MNILIQNTGNELSAQPFSPAMGTTGNVKGDNFASLLAGLIGITGSTDNELSVDVVSKRIPDKLSVPVNLFNAVRSVHKAAMVREDAVTGINEPVTGSEIAAYLVVEGDDGESVSLPVVITVAERSESEALPDETMTNSNPVLIITIQQPAITDIHFSPLSGISGESSDEIDITALHKPAITDIHFSPLSGISGENSDEIDITALHSQSLDSVISNQATAPSSPANTAEIQLTVVPGTMKTKGSAVSVKVAYPLRSDKPAQSPAISQPVVDNTEETASMDVSSFNELSLPEITVPVNSTGDTGIGESRNIPESRLASLNQQKGISIQHKSLESSEPVKNIWQVKEYISGREEMSSVEESTVPITQNNLMEGNTLYVSLPDKLTSLQPSGEQGRDNTGFVFRTVTSDTFVRIIPSETTPEENPILRLLNTMVSNGGSVEAVFTIGSGIQELQPEGTVFEKVNHDLMMAYRLVDGKEAVDNSPTVTSESFSEAIPGENRIRFLFSEVADIRQGFEPSLLLDSMVEPSVSEEAGSHPEPAPLLESDMNSILKELERTGIRQFMNVKTEEKKIITLASESAVDEIPETESIDTDTVTREPAMPRNIDDLPNTDPVITASSKRVKPIIINTDTVTEPAENEQFDGKSPETRVRTTVPPSSGDINRTADSQEPVSIKGTADNSRSIRTFLTSDDTTDNGSETQNIVTGDDQPTTGETGNEQIAPTIKRHPDSYGFSPEKGSDNKVQVDTKGEPGQFELRIQESDISPKAARVSDTSEEKSISQKTDSNGTMFKNEKIPVIENTSTAGESRSLPEDKPVKKPTYINETFRVRLHPDAVPNKKISTDNQTVLVDEIQTIKTNNVAGDSGAQNAESGNSPMIIREHVSAHRTLSSIETPMDGAGQFIAKTVSKVEVKNPGITSESENVKPLTGDFAPAIEIPEAEFRAYMAGDNENNTDVSSLNESGPSKPESGKTAAIKLEQVAEIPEVSQEDSIQRSTGRSPVRQAEIITDVIERENIILKNPVNTAENSEAVDIASNTVSTGGEKTPGNRITADRNGIHLVHTTNEHESMRDISPGERGTSGTEQVSGNGVPDGRSDDTVIKVQQQIENDTLVAVEKNSKGSSKVEPLRSQPGVSIPIPSKNEYVKEQPVRESLTDSLEGSQRVEHEGKSGFSSKHSGYGHGESESEGQNITLPRANEFRSMNKTQLEMNGTGAFQGMVTRKINTEILPGEMQKDITSNTEESITGIRQSVEKTDTPPFNTGPAINHSEQARDSQSEMLDTIVRYARIMTLKGQSSAVIKLEPPSLGRLKLEIVTERSRVTGKITVESQEVKQLIENRITELRNSLSQNGLKVETFDVQVGHNGGTDAWAQRENIERRGMTSSVSSGVSKAASGMETSEGIGSPNRAKLIHNGTFDVWI